MISQEIKLPSPRLKGEISVEEALYKRRSIRNFKDKELTLEEISQLLWAAYGTTLVKYGIHFKTAPSAGALYPLEIYLSVNKGNNVLKPGLYKYSSEKHSLKEIISRNITKELSQAAYQESMILEAPITIIITAIYEKTERRYGSRGRERYVCLDAGHVGQNIYLQAVALNLATCAIGAFDDNKVIQTLNLPKNETPLYIFPIGYPK